MNKFSNIALVLIFLSFLTTTAIFIVIVIAIRGPVFWEKPAAIENCTLESSYAIAESFIEHSATFEFDGIEGSIQLESSMEKPDSDSFELVYTYRTRHPGHGDRAWQTLSQVITDHSVTLELKDCRVISAVCDEMWDMVNQMEIQSPALRE